MSGGRRAERERATRETRIRVVVDLDGTGAARISTGIGFYDHLLTSLAGHSLVDIEIEAAGDLQVDAHHTVEDVALVLGDALAAALGDRSGITRFGDAAVPMDEALARCALDLSGRPYAVLDLAFRGERMGQLDTQLVEHALESLARDRGHDAAPVRVRPQRPPRGGGRVQGARAIPARRRHARSAAPGGDPVDQGRAVSRDAGDPVRLAIVDHGAGNLVSIRNALTLVGAETVIARDAAGLVDADAIVVPGVGASAPAMARLRRRGLVEPIWAAVAAGTWYVGICLGLQLLFERSDEDGARMLGLLPGRVSAIPDAPRLPHIGWNQLELRRPHPIVAGIHSGTPAYFVHSYAPVPDDPDVVVAETEHGGRFASLVAHERLVGFQFHPERSGRDGLTLLRDTVSLIAADRDRVPPPRQPSLAAPER